MIFHQNAESVFKTLQNCKFLDFSSDIANETIASEISEMFQSVRPESVLPKSSYLRISTSIAEIWQKVLLRLSAQQRNEQSEKSQLKFWTFNAESTSLHVQCKHNCPSGILYEHFHSRLRPYTLHDKLAPLTPAQILQVDQHAVKLSSGPNPPPHMSEPTIHFSLQLSIIISVPHSFVRVASKFVLQCSFLQQGTTEP